MRKLLLVLLALPLICAPVFAQEQMGRIEGRVITEDGLAIQGAKVVISSPDLVAGKQETTTDDKGRFRFPILPIGTYSIRVTADQYQTFEQSDIVIRIGATVVLSPMLKVGAFEEVITISGEAPLIDPKSTDLGENFSSDIISKLPLPRFPSDAVLYAAGNVEGDAYSTLGGSDSTSNAYLLDGVDVSDPETGTVWVFVNMESIEEMEFMPIAGAPANVGNFTGAAINMVTKSGGNEFSGGFAWYYFDDRFISWNTDNQDIRDTVSRQSLNNDWTFFVGGPALKDKLWFFGNVGLRKRGTLYGEDKESGDEYYLKYRNSMWKVSSVLRDDMNLWGMYHYDNYLRDRLTAYNRAPEATADQDGPNHSFAGHWAWVINDNNLWEAKVHGWKGYFGYTGSGETAYYDYILDWWYGGAYVEYQAWRSRLSINNDYTRYLNDWYGDHEVKAGLEFHRGTGRYLYHYEVTEVALGEPDVRYGYYPDWFGYERTKGWNAYIMDGWNINDRLLVNVGLRLDTHTYNVPDQQVPDAAAVAGPGDIHTFYNLAPRIGFTYKLTDDGRTILRGSWGRYYETVGTSLLTQLNPAQPDWVEYYWDGAEWVEYYREAGGSGLYSLDPDLKGTYTEAFTFGLEKEIFRNIAVGVEYLHREYKDIIVKEETGLTYEPFTFSYEGKSYTIYNWTGGEPSYNITNAPDELYSKYDAVILRAAKRYSDNWQLQASLTISNFRGTAGDEGDSYDQFSGDLDAYSDPNYRINWEGKFYSHRPYNLKLIGTYTLPYETSVSAFVTYINGPTWTPRLRYRDDALGQFSVTFLAEPLGSRRLDSQFNVDMRIEKVFHFKAIDFSLLADIYNLFNDGTYSWIITRMDLSDYQEPTSIVRPRSFQVGMRFSF